MKFNANIDIFFAEENALIELFEAFAKEVIRKALKEYLKAALALIPIRTEFLRGSFSEIEKFFGVVAAKLYGSTPRDHEFYYPVHTRAILKTPTSGIQFNTPPDQVIKVQGDTINIELDTDISYYGINDSKWGSSDAGLIAFYNSLEVSINEFPEIEEILGITTIQLRENSVSTLTKSAGLSSRAFALRAF